MSPIGRSVLASSLAMVLVLADALDHVQHRAAYLFAEPLLEQWRGNVQSPRDIADLDNSAGALLDVFHGRA